ncbi:MAG: hypothetical protein DHS80DRAFT_33079 [Piptocephalis tieghemiana]|nr:MAG: hypothetical protein DHS80DRAFT_33079 [Piptocephalis tieghemiana]
MSQAVTEPSSDAFSGALDPTISSSHPPFTSETSYFLAPASAAMSDTASPAPAQSGAPYSTQQIVLVVGVSVGAAAVVLIAVAAFLIIRNRRLKTKADEWIISST